MIKKINIPKVLFVISIFFLGACSVSPMTGMLNLKSQKPHPEDKPLACYLDHCFETTLSNQLVDPAGDYIYPDPEKFSNVAMRPQYIAPYAFLDLKNLDADTSLTTNFKMGEILIKENGRYGLFSSAALTQLQLMRNDVARSIIINSGYRSPGHNKRIDGSATWSRHTYGDAVDIVISGMKIKDMPAYCKKFGANFTLTYAAHIHCDWRKVQLDPAYYMSATKSLTPAFDITPAKMIAEQSRFVVADYNTQFSVSAEVPLHEEEEGSPTHEWTVTLPSGEIQTEVSDTIMLPKQTGDFQIHLVVGGSIVLDEVVTW
jgi:hypothetical protein